MSLREIEGVPERRKTIHKEVKKNPSLYCCDRISEITKYNITRRHIMSNINNQLSNDNLIMMIESKQSELEIAKGVDMETYYKIQSELLDLLLAYYEGGA